MNNMRMNNKYMYTYNIKDKEDCDKQFIEFMDNIEQIVFDKFNLYLLDLPDEDYYEYYERKCTPEQVANIVIKGNMCF